MSLRFQLATWSLSINSSRLCLQMGSNFTVIPLDQRGLLTMSEAMFPNQRWMLIADIHFKKETLTRNATTLTWLKAEFDTLKPSHVIFLGDTTNHREHISWDTLFALVGNLIGYMVDADWQPTIHLLVGNHDMNDRVDRTVNSASIISVGAPRIKAYPQITKASLDGHPVIFLPYHADQSEIATYLQHEYPDHTRREDTVVFGHLALHGAPMNASGRIYEGAELTVDTFNGFLFVFMGHFHRHACYGERGNIVYVGSPVQLNFGEAGDLDKGYVAYDPKGASFVLQRNPHAEQFVTLTVEQAQALIADASTEVQGKMVQVKSEARIDRKVIDAVRKGLQEVALACGVAPARELAFPVFVDPAEKSVEDQKQANGLDILDYAKEYIAGRDDWKQEDNDQGERMIAYIGEKSRQLEANGKDEGSRIAETFVAELVLLEIENFLGIQGKRTFQLQDMRRGVWLTQGRNGTGKTTIIEAIVWCLYGICTRGENVGKKNTVSQVVHLEATTCAVTLRFKNGLEVRRTRSKATGKGRLTLRRPDGTTVEKGSAKDTQQLLEKMVNVDSSTFVNTVILNASQTQTFANAGDERKRMIDDLLGFAVLEDYADLMALDNTRINAELKQAGLQAQGLRGRLQVFAEVTGKMLSENAEGQRKLDLMRREMESLHGKREVAEAEVQEAMAAEKVAREVVGEEEAGVRKLTADLGNASERATDLRSRFDALLHKARSALQDEISDLTEKRSLARDELRILEQNEQRRQGRIQEAWANLLTAEKSLSETEAKASERKLLVTRQADLDARRAVEVDKVLQLQQELRSTQEKIGRLQEVQARKARERQRYSQELRRLEQARVIGADARGNLVISLVKSEIQTAIAEFLSGDLTVRERGEAFVARLESKALGLLETYLAQHDTTLAAEQQTDRVQEVEERVAVAVKREQQAEQLLAAARAAEYDLQRNLHATENQLTATQTTLRMISDQLLVQDATESLVMRKRQEADQLRHTLTLLEADTGEPLSEGNDAETLKREISNIEERLTAAKRRWQDAKCLEDCAEIASSEERRLLTDSLREVEQINGDLVLARRQLAISNARAAQAQNATNIANKRLHAIVCEISHVEGGRNMLLCDVARQNETLKKLQADTNAAETQLRDIEGVMTDLQAQSKVVTRWLKVWRGQEAAGSTSFRSFCLERNVENINSKLQVNIDILNRDINDAWGQTLSCSLDSELKVVETGTGLSFFKMSEGQRKRMQLALFFAIFEVAQSRSAFRPKILFLDEIFDALDRDGQMAVQRWISYYSQANPDIHIFVVTHSDSVDGFHRDVQAGRIDVTFGTRGSQYAILPSY